MTSEHHDFIFIDYDGDMNTRAVPGVPELVRYERTVADERQEHFGMVEHRYGEYVLHSKAAEIIAVKDKEIERLRRKLRQEFELGLTMLERAEAAEAKLAQYEAQEPVACVYGQSNGDGTYSPQYYPHYPLPEYIKPHKEYPIRLLYASPATSADLKAENEKLRKALSEIYGNGDATGCNPKIKVEIARAALDSNNA